MTNAQYIPGVAELGRKNQPSGYVGIDSSGDVIGTFAQRVDTEANLSSVVLAVGELAYASDTQSIFVGDGVTAGGKFLWQQWQSQMKYGSNALAEYDSDSLPDSGLSLPLVAGNKYEFRVAVRFYGDTNNSNFMLVVAHAGVYSDFRELWIKALQSFYSVETTEERSIGIPVTESLLLLAPTLSLTESELQVMLSLSIQSTGTGFVKFSPTKRTSDATTARATASYQWRRVK